MSVGLGSRPGRSRGAWRAPRSRSGVAVFGDFFRGRTTVGYYAIVGRARWLHVLCWPFVGPGVGIILLHPFLREPPVFVRR
jgi:hypothetical protein